LPFFAITVSAFIAATPRNACNAISAMQGFLFGRYSEFTPLRAMRDAD
jgi:hypothetical protein